LLPGIHFAVFGVLLFLFAAALLQGQTQIDEFQVKAAFVFHFAQLVEWPADTLGAENQPLVFCSAGEDSFSTALGTVIQGKQVGAHPIQIRHVREKDDLHGCHLLFIAGKDKTRGPAILARLKDAPILTVGESENFARQGGIIGLSVQENKIRFDINLNSAQRANLKISSRLLLLAKSVIGGGRQG